MEYRKVIEQIIVLAFEKARKESLQTLKTPLSKHISSKIEHDFRIYISEKTFVRYYDKFIGGKENATGVPNRKILDFVCKYIGYDNFIDFYNKKEKNENKKNKKKNGEELNFLSLPNEKEINTLRNNKIIRKNSLYFNLVKTYYKEKISKLYINIKNNITSGRISMQKVVIILEPK